MFAQYIKHFARSFIRHRTSSVINILGLSTGLACCLIILLWVRDEISYDRFHEHFDRIYRVMSYGTKYMINGTEATPGPLAVTLRSESALVQQAVSIQDVPKSVVKTEELSYYESGIILTEPAFFDIFSTPFLIGDPQTAFEHPFSIILTKSASEKYFGKEPAMGRELDLDGDLLTVSGIIEDFPGSSHLKTNMMIPLKILEEMGGSPQWGYFSAMTYVLLPSESAVHEAGEHITGIAAGHHCPQVADGVAFRLQPLKDVHLDGKHAYYRSCLDIGDSRYVIVFSLIALLVLMVAGFNYVNLVTARSELRGKEIGLRKVVGAGRGQIVRQCLYESLTFSLLSVVLALGIVELALNWFNEITGKNIDLNIAADPGLIIILLGLILAAAFLSGSYPALFLSRFQPLDIFQRRYLGSGNRRVGFRRGLVVFQFVMAVAMIFSAGIIHQQLTYIRNYRLGFNPSNVLTFPIKGAVESQFETMKNRLLNLPQITHVSAQDYVWALINNRTTGFNWQGKDPDLQLDMLIPRVDRDFFETLDIPMAAGKSFAALPENKAADRFIINQEAQRRMGLTDPLGKWLEIYGFDGLLQRGEIVGVMEDIHFSSLRNQVEPQVVRQLNEFEDCTQYGAVLIRMTSGDIPSTLTEIEKIWYDLNPSIPFEFQFMDDIYHSLYMNEIQLSQVLNLFTLLILIIAVLGLYGLTAFLVEQKTREIIIRRILGAGYNHVVRLVLNQFIIIMAVSVVIAVPFSWWLMSRWLNQFVFHINPGLSTLLPALLIPPAITVGTIIGLTLRNTAKNPANTLYSD